MAKRKFTERERAVRLAQRVLTHDYRNIPDTEMENLARMFLHLHTADKECREGAKNR